MRCWTSSALCTVPEISRAVCASRLPDEFGSDQSDAARKHAEALLK